MTSAVVLSVLGLVAIIGYLGIFIALHVLPTGYHPVRHAVSDYAVGSYGNLFRRGLILSSAGLLLTTFALFQEPGSPPLKNSSLVLLVLVPVARVGMAMFPTNLEHEKITRTGLLHYLFAVAAFALTYTAISQLTPDLMDISPWSSFGGLLEVLHWIILVSLVLLVVTMMPHLRRVFGLFERCFLVSTNIWFIAVGIGIISAAS
ncbi:DUF998 domain-containing protein [Streptomyces sp. NPDC048409]|uniref:DUF998 domain-containing protein n=1 Tax=Streptomyces sp. NPDC048409 TaxID=3154723 RepID=UPI0034322B87